MGLAYHGAFHLNTFQKIRSPNLEKHHRLYIFGNKHVHFLRTITKIAVHILKTNCRLLCCCSNHIEFNLRTAARGTHKLTNKTRTEFICNRIYTRVSLVTSLIVSDSHYRKLRESYATL